jgi:hypothetical protein
MIPDQSGTRANWLPSLEVPPHARGWLLLIGYVRSAQKGSSLRGTGPVAATESRLSPVKGTRMSKDKPSIPEEEANPRLTPEETLAALVSLQSDLAAFRTAREIESRALDALNEAADRSDEILERIMVDLPAFLEVAIEEFSNASATLQPNPKLNKNRFRLM